MENTYEIFMGRLGVKPELRYTTKHEPVCALSVAVDRKDIEKPIWKRVVVWGKQAELCNLYLKKGHEVFVQGRMQLREYHDSEGRKRSVMECNARLIGFPNI